MLSAGLSMHEAMICPHLHSATWCHVVHQPVRNVLALHSRLQTASAYVVMRRSIGGIPNRLGGDETLPRESRDDIAEWVAG